MTFNISVNTHYSHIELHVYYLGLKELFLTLRKGTERNDSFLLNPVVVTWRYFMDSYIGRIDGMSNIRSFR